MSSFLRLPVRNKVYILFSPACFSSCVLLCNPGCDFFAFPLYFSPPHPTPLPCLGYLWAPFVHSDCVTPWFLTDHTSVASLLASCSPLRCMCVSWEFQSHSKSPRQSPSVSPYVSIAFPNPLHMCCLWVSPTLVTPEVSCTIHFVYFAHEQFLGTAGVPTLLQLNCYQFSSIDLISYRNLLQLFPLLLYHKPTPIP